MKNKLLKLVVLSTIILFFNSCKKDINTISIGSTLDLSGPNAVYGDQVKQGLDLAIEELNIKGGIKGKKIEINYLDSRSDSKIAVTNTQKLISFNNCSIIIGEISSTATQAMIPVIEQNGAFLFAPASSSPNLSNISRNFARNWPSDVAEAVSAANFAKNNFLAKTATIVYVNSDYGIGLKDKFKNTFLKEGGKVISSITYNVNTNDFKTIAIKIKQDNSECIYLAGNPKEMGACIKQMREFGINSKVISNTGFLQDDCLKIAGKFADGVVVPTPEYSPNDTTNKSVFEFYKKFKAKYNQEPTMVNANAYDAIFLIKDAIEIQGDNPKKIAELIRNKKGFIGATGKVDFVNGDVEVAITFKIINNGKPINYKK